MSPRARLEAGLAGLGPVAVAVSGGVDSLTLAALAHRVLGPEALTVHAVSPAVPGEATARVRDEAARGAWDLRVIEAGEFADPRYRANPVNRCFFCKTNLYGAIRHVTDRQILSGANTDDLGEYRPGLDAAREHGVRHPYVEAGFDKGMVRALSRDLGLGAVAELPAAPCLSSRIETGIAVEPETLAFVHAAEGLVGAALGGGAGPGRAVRCRVRAGGTVIELDPASLDTLTDAERGALGAGILARAPARLAGQGVSFRPYRVGSAFLTGRTPPHGTAVAGSDGRDPARAPSPEGGVGRPQRPADGDRRASPPHGSRACPRSASPPPCGEEPEVGVVQEAPDRSILRHPHPYPSPQGGGEPRRGSTIRPGGGVRMSMPEREKGPEPQASPDLPDTFRGRP